MDITDKDVYETIVHSSDDRTVLEMLSVNKKFNQDDAFRRVLLRRYSYLIAFRKEGETWKGLYLRMIYYIEKLKEDFDFPYINYKTFNPDSEYQRYVKYSDKGNVQVINEFGLHHAVRANRFDLVKYFLDKGAKNISVAYALATFHHNLEFMKFFESLGNPINYILASGCAANGNHLDLVKFLINEKNVTSYNSALSSTGNWDIIKYLVNEKGANGFNSGLSNAGYKKNWRELTDYFIGKGANNFNEALKTTVDHDNIKMMKYLVDKGANNFAEALLKAVMRQKVEIVKYLVETMLERNIPLNLFAVVRYDISMNPDENFQVIKYFIDTFLERLNLQFLANIAEAKGKNKIYNYLISKI